MFDMWQEEPLEKGIPYYLKKNEGMSHSLLVESCLVVDSNNSWWIKSRPLTIFVIICRGFN